VNLRLARAAVLAALASAALLPASAPARVAELPPLHVVRGADARIEDSSGRQVLLRGVNVNQLGDYYRGSPALDPTIPLTEQDFVDIARVGFDSVRLIVHWSALEPTRGAFDEAYVARIRQAVEWAKAHGIYTVVDMHQDAWGKHVDTPPGEICAPGATPSIGWDGAPGWATLTDGMPTCQFGGVRELSPAVAQAWQNFYADRDGIQGRLVETWRRLAHAFAGEPAVAGFDIVNEPHPGFAPSASAATELAAFYTRALTAIRAGERGGLAHVVFFEPLVVWSASAVDVVPPPTFTDDPNIVFAPHLYAGSISADRTAGAPFLTPHDGHQAAAGAASGYQTTYWSGEWGWFGDPAKDRGDIAMYAAEEDARRVGGAWWDWKQACGDPHQINDARGGGTSPSLNRYACPQQRALGIPATTRRILARAYPRAAPGRLTALESNPESGALRLTGADDDLAGSCALEVWLPGERGRPALTGVNVAGIAVAPFAGGWLAHGCAKGAYELRTSGFGAPPPPSSANGARCLPRRASIRRTGIGRVRLGATRGQLLRATDARPVRVRPYAYAWCVSGSPGRLTAVFGRRSRGGRAQLVTSTAAAHRTRGVGRGSSRRRVLRRFPGARRIRGDVYRAGPRGHRLLVVRGPRLRAIGVARRALIAHPPALARAFRRAAR
jgi:endoglycosylceramidase